MTTTKIQFRLISFKEFSPAATWPLAAAAFGVAY
jgi:hypothetical protein